MNFKITAATLALIAVAFGPIGAQARDAGGAEVHEIFRQPLAEKPGMDVVVITVTYPPGGATPAHKHPGFVYAYVLKGGVTSALGNQPPKTYSEGQSWSEQPFQEHRISKNASNTAPAELLVFFIIPQGAKLTVPVSSP
jgi:quercetin dioxygenase-like cupin family protein